MKVYKFGGASVRNADGIKNLVSIVSRELSCTDNPSDVLVVVVSAMGKTTNALERLVSLALAGEEELMLRQLNDIREYHYGIVDALFPCGHIFLQNKLEAVLQHILGLCKAALIDKPEYDRFYDSVVSCGELMSTRIISYVLDRESLLNVYLDMTTLLRTDDTYREARPDIQASGSSLRKYIQ